MKSKQKLLPTFRAERGIVIPKKVIPHKRGGVVIRFRTKVRQQYGLVIRWD